MFLLPAPEVRETEVFTRMPERFRRTGVRSDWADANRGGQPTDSFLEGPVFDADGNLYVTDIPFGRIFRIDPEGEWEQVAECDGEPNGMKFLNERELLDHRLPQRPDGLRHRERARCALPRAAQQRTLQGRQRPDRSTAAATSTSPTRARPACTIRRAACIGCARDGQLDLLLANVPSPNGVALSPDERVLYLGVTRGNAVWRVPLLDDGSVAKVSAFFTSYGPSGPDGLAMDQKGPADRRQPGPRCRLGAEPSRASRKSVLRSCAGASLTNVAFGGARPQDPLLHGVDQRFGAAGRTRRTRDWTPSPVLRPSATR